MTTLLGTHGHLSVHAVSDESMTHKIIQFTLHQIERKTVIFVNMNIKLRACVGQMK